MMKANLRTYAWSAAGAAATKILHLDLETQNKPYFGGVASPRHPENYVVAVGWAVDAQPYSGEVCWEYYQSKEEAADWLHIPDDVWLIVAHNASYEIDWMMQNARDKFLAFLRRGGKVFCTQLGHYLLSNQQDTYPALGDIAPLYGGTPKVDGIKALWESGVLTADIDQDLLIEYLAGPAGDIDNTRKCFYGQFAKMSERGMFKMMMTRMEALIFNAIAMHTGLKIHRELAFAQLTIQEHQLNALVEAFKQHRANFPAQCEFKEGSAFHMSSWLYGGPVKYKARLPYSYDGSPEQYVKADFVRFGDVRLLLSEWEALSPEAKADASFKYGGIGVYKAGKNKGLLKVYREDTNEVKLKWWDQVYNAPGIVDLNLLSKELREEFVKEHTGKRKHANGQLVIGTGGDPLKVLAKRPEFSAETRAVLNDLLEFAKLDKDLGTYYLREQFDEDGNVIKQAGMLQYLNDLDIVNHNLNGTSTATTRLSSNKPNFQNLPRGGTSDVKRMFISRFGKDGCIIEADYSALEVVTLAAFSKDKALIEALLNNIDMHCLRLAGQLNEPYDEVLKKCKDQTHPDHVRYDEMRTAIKPKAFQYQYGATAYGIAFSTGCTVEEAQAFIDNEKALFPDVERWFEECVFPQVEKTTVRKREEVYNAQGVAFWRQYGVGTWTSPAGTSFEFRQWPKTIWADGKKVEVMVYKPTQMRNYPIQGESAFFVQGMCGQVMRWLVDKDFYSVDGVPMVHIINTVHDAIYLDCHLSILDEVASNLKRIMESLPDYFKERHGYDLGVPFPAAVEFGANMMQKIHWHPGVLDEPGVWKEVDGQQKYYPSAREQLAAEWAEMDRIIAEAATLKAAA